MRLGKRRKAEEEDPRVYLVEGPFLVGVLCKLVNEGVQLLWDNDTVSRDGTTDSGVGLSSPSGTFLDQPNPTLSVPRSHLRVSTGRGSKLPSASTVAFFSVLDE